MRYILIGRDLVLLIPSRLPVIYMGSRNRRIASMALYAEPLDFDSWEFRILIIHPGPPDSPVKCSIRKTSLINPIDYAALSYCWGDAAITKDIFVNSIETPVTSNLADALQHLRRLGVSKIWVDALCINQTDKLEKGLQIRNMHLIFSKASVTYSWLGREEDNNDTSAAIDFLTSLQNSHNDMTLAQTPHTCQERGRDHQDALQILCQDGDCRRCTTEIGFRALQHLLQRQYWKRRWIIQEVSVSRQPMVLCGYTAITLEEMSQAITRCRDSCYWSAVTETAFAWFRVTMQFKQSYQKGYKTALCRAIGLTKRFESTEPRDAIFSLLALCHDGSELVPIPNYFEPIEAILLSLTKAVISRSRRLDIILCNERNQKDSRQLPSWCLDWLSAHLTSRTYDLANGTPWCPEEAKRLFCLGDSIGRNISLGDGRVLRVQGVAVGKIVTMTSATNSVEVRSPDPSPSNIRKPAWLRKQKRPRGSDTSSQFLNSSPPFYYSNLKEVLTALCSCLNACLQPAGKPPLTSNPLQYSKSHIGGCSFCLWCATSISEPSQSGPEACDVGQSGLGSNIMFFEWLKANAMFPIQGRTIDELFKGQTFWCTPTMRALCFPLIILCALLPIILLGLIITLICMVFIGYINPLFMLIYIMLSLFGLGTGLLLGFHFWRYQQYIRRLKLHQHDWTHLVKPGKRLIISDKGSLGMVDERAKKGDVLFYLVGCSEPMVLRKVGRDGDAVTDRVKYTIVGKCYHIHLNRTDEEVYLGPDEDLSTEDPRGSKYQKLKEQWVKDAEEKGLIEEIDLI